MKRYSLVLVALLYIPALGAQQVAEPSPIGYATIEEAFNMLKADPGAGMKEHEGWTIFNQKGDGKYILWSFTPADHPAHPSVIRREVVKKEGEIFIKMDALCDSNQLDCDLLIDQFKKINERIRQDWAGSS
ncbi:MAG: hypothetical protein OES20_01950 [Gammaproteobacteria bacterium]|nr:hypothetical protein [Gammaproteobacteria bacterium]MDH3857561.1 hypothetical protein [Gammaproteobacteria bacterium]